MARHVEYGSSRMELKGKLASPVPYVIRCSTSMTAYRAPIGDPPKHSSARLPDAIGTWRMTKPSEASLPTPVETSRRGFVSLASDSGDARTTTAPLASSTLRTIGTDALHRCLKYVPKSDAAVASTGSDPSVTQILKS